MLTAISAIIGFLASVVPQLIKLWQQRDDRKHELALLDKQVEVQKILGTQRIEEAGIKADIAESLALYKHSEAKLTGWKWADVLIIGLNALVRPVITFAYFGSYLAVKFAMFSMMRAAHISWEQAAVRLWSPFDEAMFAGIMGFWFGQRMMNKWFNDKR